MITEYYRSEHVAQQYELRKAYPDWHHVQEIDPKPATN